jgi:hypothetical protein
MNKSLLDVDQLMGHFVEIMMKSKIIDPESGREINYGKTAYFRGCDGMFIYYSFDNTGEVSGMVPVSEIIDIVRIDHVEDLMGEDDFEGYET